ncbi:MAG: flagellar motor switch protein FliM [Gammaproteobacteria bacterium]|jgi:flagellar motor switch protein FliM
MDNTILVRMTTRPTAGAVDVPLTSTRALRLAVTRAADRSLGMTLTVAKVAEDLKPLDAMVAMLPDEMSFVRLERAGVLVGLVALDVQLRAAANEIQTMGQVSTKHAVDRAYTGTDMMLAAPLCEGVLSLLPQTTQGSDLDGWVDDVTLGDPFDSLRAASLTMADADYRIMRVTVDLVPDSRQGEMIIALPNHQPAAVSTPEFMSDGTWDRRMHAAVSQAPATLRAVLHKMDLTLGYVDSLQIGDILPLSGATVGSVRLFAPDDVMVGRARLGQSAGMRAVRIQAPPEPELHDIPTPKPAEIAQVD